MGRYTENFTLKDIFNNQELANHLPIVNYRERKYDGDKVSVRTQMKTVKRQIFDTSIKVARYYYKPLAPTRSGDMLILDGNLIGDHDACVNDIYDNLVGFRPFLMFTANNGDIIRSALKESEKNTRKYGIDSKLFLRAQSMMEIQGMSLRRLRHFMDDVMGNILFGDNFPETQKKYKVFEQDYGNKDYNTMRKEWRKKVGI